MSHLEASARERRGDKELEQHGHVRARAAAVMATRWSRAHEEIYLRRKMEWRWCLRRREGHDGAVAWTNWLMELGDGGFGSAVSRCPGRRAHGGRRGNAKMERRLGGQALGASRRGCPCQGVHGVWPARSGERRRVAPRGVSFLNRSATTFTKCFLKNAIQCKCRRLTASIQR